jgi:hypothetical protein
VNDKEIYGLTITRAIWISKRNKPMPYFAAWLRNKGYKVAYVRENHLGVYAKPAEVWAALTPSSYESGAMRRRDVPRRSEESPQVP